jgi:CheY-like chemotaxis protein
MALLNFAANARDAMPVGGKLTVSTRNLRLDAPVKATGDLVGEFVQIAVRDTGSGMPEEARARAFEPFYTTKGPGKGTGLGLSTVYGFAVQAGGAATIASVPGSGTVVTLYLPRAAEAPAAAPVPPAAGHQEGRLRVLLVDDDPQVRMLTREMLLELGHDVIDASSGAAALEFLHGGEAFDLLLADFAMPVMNGSQLAAEAARLRPDLPVLLMTGFVDSVALKSWLDLGRRALRKPFGASELAEALFLATATRNASPAR